MFFQVDGCCWCRRCKHVTKSGFPRMSHGWSLDENKQFFPRRFFSPKDFLTCVMNWHPWLMDVIVYAHQKLKGYIWLNYEYSCFGTCIIEKSLIMETFQRTAISGQNGKTSSRQSRHVRRKSSSVLHSYICIFRCFLVQSRKNFKDFNFTVIDFEEKNKHFWAQKL